MNQAQGMKWYSALKVLLPLWSIWEIMNSLATWSNVATNAGLSFVTYLSLDAALTLLSFGSVIGDVALMMVMCKQLRDRDSNVVKAPLYLIGFTCGYSVLMALYTVISYSPVYYAVLGSVFGPVLNRVIIFLPTYFYLKNRFPRISQTAATVSEPSVSPFDYVPIKLMGVADQAARDQIIADLFVGNINPYTGRSIVCEADWDAYVTAYFTDQDAALQKNTLPAVEAIKESVPQPDSAVPPITSHPSYCRQCGGKLHADSRFCEFCGLPVKDK